MQPLQRRPPERPFTPTSQPAACTKPGTAVLHSPNGRVARARHARAMYRWVQVLFASRLETTVRVHTARHRPSALLTTITQRLNGKHKYKILLVYSASTRSIFVHRYPPRPIHQAAKFLVQAVGQCLPSNQSIQSQKPRRTHNVVGAGEQKPFCFLRQQARGGGIPCKPCILGVRAVGQGLQSSSKAACTGHA